MKAESKTFRLSRRLSIEITAGVEGMVVEWDPSIPYELTANESVEYHKAMAEMLAGIAAVISDQQ